MTSAQRPPPPHRTWGQNRRQGDGFGRKNRRWFAAGLLLLTAACSGGDGDTTTGEPTTTTTSSPTASSTTAAPATAATTITSRATTTTARVTSTTAPATAPTTRPSGVTGGEASLATAAGRYTYDTTGTFTSPLGAAPRNGATVLTVDPSASGQQRGVRVGPGRTVEQVLQKQGDGVYLVSLSITDSGFSQQVRPAAPVLAIPAPAPVGREWSWQSPTVDGRTTVSSSFRVARTETVTVGGEAVPTWVVEATITTTGDVVSTGRQTFWFSERHRLIVQLQEVTDGRVAGAIAFRSETTERLRSLTPA